MNPTTLPETATAEPVPTVDHVVTTTTISPPPGTSVDTTTTIQLPTEPVDYLAVGDSVMLGAAPSLTQRGLFVDAAVSRQMIDMIPVFEQLRDRHLLGTAVVVHLGNNGPISQATLDAFLATMDDVPNVILLTVKADRSWTADNNALLRAADHEGDNKILLDWEVPIGRVPRRVLLRRRDPPPAGGPAVLREPDLRHPRDLATTSSRRFIRSGVRSRDGPHCRRPRLAIVFRRGESPLRSVVSRAVDRGPSEVLGAVGSVDGDDPVPVEGQSPVSFVDQVVMTAA